jgi:membrane protein YdbS with pleckstrin-like domain
MGRWLGYCTLKLYTAGASGANLEIPGLSMATARNIRRMLEDQSHE